MKLTELLNSVNLRVREVTNFVRSPMENVSRIAIRRVQEEYEKVEIPFGQDNGHKENSVEEVKVKTVDRDTTPRGELRSESSAQTNPLGFAPKPTHQIEITPLQKADYIQGRRGRLQVKSDVPVKTFERARLYEGVQVANCKAILIKEYLLPEADFNQKEAGVRKEKFEELASLNLNNGGGQDFRLMIPRDAIAPRHERRCYLITKPIDNSITLREYLEQTNCPMTSKQVREVLKQVLQTLWFLHNQRVRFPNGEVRSGLLHGNLTLDSLLIVTNDRQSIIEERQFFIYLCDLALWEDLFKLPTAKLVKHSPEKDLKDLGYLSFYLLSGGDKDPVYGQDLDPKNEQHWLQVDDINLKNFLCRLLGLDTPFANADEARQALLAVTPSQAIEEQVEKEIEEGKKEHLNYSISKSLILRILLTCFSVGLVGTLFVMFILSLIPKNL